MRGPGKSETVSIQKSGCRSAPPPHTRWYWRHLLPLEQHLGFRFQHRVCICFLLICFLRLCGCEQVYAGGPTIHTRFRVNAHALCIQRNTDRNACLLRFLYGYQIDTHQQCLTDTSVITASNIAAKRQAQTLHVSRETHSTDMHTHETRIRMRAHTESVTAAEYLDQVLPKRPSA